MLGATAGFAMTSGAGAFGGGFFYSFRASSDLSMGAYFNGALDQTDNTLPPETLLGVQVQFVPWSSVQADFMLCHLFVKGEFFSWGTAEAGIGVFRNFGPAIIGAEVYYFRDVANRPVTILGLSGKSPSDRSISFLLGLSNVDRRWTPIIQAAVPILGK